jgi:hypothetical protein
MTMMGEFLRAAPKNEGAKGSGSNQHKKELRSTNGTAPPTLSDLGIGKKESSDAQALAALKAERPELHERVRRGETTVSKARQVPVSPPAARPRPAARRSPAAPRPRR